MATTYVPIQSVTLGSSAASVTFSSIPQTYTDLVVRVSARTDRAASYDSLKIRPNNNSSNANYSFTYLYGMGSSAGSYNVTTGGSYTNLTNIAINGDLSTSSTFSSDEIYIPVYSGNAKKPIAAIGIQESNSSTANAIDITAQLFHDTTAISSLVIFAVGNFVAGSTFHLYGIKNS